MESAQAKQPAGWTAKAGLAFVLWFGAVNLFADFAYEGARSVSGPFLAALGASGFIAGAAGGFGELVGYALRLVSGRWADRTRLYWPITLAGYVIQMIAVPALALAGSWPAAVLLIVAERAGKATRNPPRDVMLSEAGERMGRGWAFGVNEALDQLGAFIGPLVVAGVFGLHHDYRLAFAWLAAPGAVVLILVFSARLRFSYAGQVSRRSAAAAEKGYPARFWWYAAGSGLVAVGFADYALIAFHFAKTQAIAPAAIPIAYAFAMALGGLGSLVFGKLYDRVGLVLLLPVTLVGAAFAPLVFLGDGWAAIAGVLLWGVGLGVHESVMSAAVADMIPVERRAGAYGLFTLIFGVAWFAGSAAEGWLYDVSIPGLVALALAAQLAALIPLALAARKPKAA